MKKRSAYSLHDRSTRYVNDQLVVMSQGKPVRVPLDKEFQKHMPRDVEARKVGKNGPELSASRANNILVPRVGPPADLRGRALKRWLKRHPRGRKLAWETGNYLDKFTMNQRLLKMDVKVVNNEIVEEPVWVDYVWSPIWRHYLRSKY